MLVACPSCSASYELSAAVLGTKGRTVRCTGCKTTWFVAPPAEIEDSIPLRREDGASAIAAPITGVHQVARAGLRAVENTDPAPEATPTTLRARRRRPNFTPPRQRRSLSLRPATVVVALGCLAFGGATIWRDGVVAAFPQAAPLYASLGLPVNLRGLTFRDVTSSEDVEDGTPMLHISGRIDNISGRPQQVPRLRLAVRGNHGREIYVWTAVPPKSHLAAGEGLRFNAELAAPPAEGREVAVRFLKADDLTASLGKKSVP